MKPAVWYSAASRGNVTYHDIIALNQKLSVKGSRDFKSLRDFSGGNLDLEVEEGGEGWGGRDGQNMHNASKDTGSRY